ncbi:hypothetical protein O1R50_01815 [Glycomyces luteolus]|uniref:Uncharacterized protein n=1 Tax=Glycomyces luteolus TaxID=2670330 RepID=A0A9X3P673_9ACTN|nr:hypothetical protein [Glycomyces luteolus]MDA1358336.1 hypothetical protein [Glycomyces luteolus]
MIWTLAILVSLAGALYFGVRAARRELREGIEDLERHPPDLTKLTDAQRAEYERLLAANRLAQAVEDAERAAAERLMREQDEQEGR